MKKNCFCIFLFMLTVNMSIAEAQTMFRRRFQPIHVFGIRAGLNIASQYSPGSEDAFEVMSIAGVNAGGYYTRSLNRLLAVQTELSFSVRGSHWIEYNYSRDEAKDILTYFDLPLLLRYQPHHLVNIHAGPQLSYLARATLYSYKTGLRKSIEDYYKPFDLGVVVGVQSNLPKNIDLTFRYIRGLISVNAPGGYNYKTYNNSFQLTAGYRFERERKLQSKSRTYIRRRK